MTLRLLDLFSGAGGAARGYQQAGFYVVGVDINLQPRYAGDEFIQADALEFIAAHGHEYEVIHASPPCQVHSEMTKGRWKDKLKNHLDLIPAVRQVLIATGKPYIIENVEGARAELINPLLLCGTMFGLCASNEAQLWRHRYFETSPILWFSPAACRHEKQPAIGVYGGGQHPLRKTRVRKNTVIGVYGSTGGQSNRDNKSFYGISDRKLAMGIDWMTGKELNQAIPPKYTEFIGRELLRLLELL
jgi:DNA (cytosine-5)-methyltransferase 1